MLVACSSKEDRLFQQAQLATDKGDFTKAIRLYTTLLKQDPDNIAAHTNRGILFERLPVKMIRNAAKTKPWPSRIT